MKEKQKIFLAIAVFIVTFIVFRAIFSNWNYLKELLF
jgi:hypothetical protein